VVPELVTVLETIRGLHVPWYVAGGWAIDLFVGQVTREHQDVDIVVARDDQRAVFDHFSERKLLKVTPHAAGLVGQGTVEAWGGERLDLPLHQVFADDAAGDRIEILFGEIEGGLWRYRRNPSITRSVDDMWLLSDDGIPFLAPEIVLLFKAKLMRSWDDADFETVAFEMPNDRRTWFRDALEQSHPGHRWIAELA
jgi:hypothetical protein